MGGWTVRGMVVGEALASIGGAGFLRRQALVMKFLRHGFERNGIKHD